MGIITNDKFITKFGIVLPSTYICFKEESLILKSVYINVYEQDKQIYNMQKKYYLDGNYRIYNSNNTNNVEYIEKKYFSILLNESDIDIPLYTIGYNYLKQIYKNFTDDITVTTNYNSSSVISPITVIVGDILNPIVPSVDPIVPSVDPIVPLEEPILPFMVTAVPINESIDPSIVPSMFP